MSKRILEYESEKVLPDSIIEIIEKCESRMMRDRYERDKLFLHLSNMRHEIILYFANHSREAGE